MKSLKLALLLGAALAAVNLSALADSVFKPLKSKAEISALKPGTEVAHQCPHCGAITVSKMDKDKSHAESHTCPECKMQVTYKDAGAGKGPKVGFIACVDTKTGKQMSARVCAAHK